MAHLISLRRCLPYGGRRHGMNAAFEATDVHAKLLIATGVAREETLLEYNNRQMRAASKPGHADETGEINHLGSRRKRRARNEAATVDDAAARYDRMDLVGQNKAIGVE